MRDYNFYIDKAKLNCSFKSDLELNRAMGFKGSVISMVRNGHTHLSEDSMIKLAKLAGIDHELALMDLGYMKTDGEAKAAFASILQKLQACFMIGAAIIGLSGSPAHAQSVNPNDMIVYIM